MILGDGLNGIAGTTLVEEFRMRMLDRLKDGRRCEGILRKLGIIVEQETYIAVLVSDKWFNAEKPTVPPSFVTLDLEAKQAVVPTSSGDVRAPIGHYIMQDEGTMEVLGAISPADYRRDYRELGFREQTPDEEVRQARTALAGHPVNVHLSTTSDLETLLRRVLRDWKDQRERITDLENRNREMAIDNARLRISAATPDPVIRAGQIQQIATAIIQRDGQTAGVNALNTAITIVDGMR